MTRGPVVRAEACSGDFYSALDHAIAKLDARLRRVADRRRVHRGRRAPVSVAAATSGLPSPVDDLFAPVPEPAGVDGVHGAAVAWDEDDQPWHIVREKEHDAPPMTIDDALYHM